MENIGDIDERGFINNLDKNGYSIEQCILEITGNSIDAKANNIVYNINKNISIIDDGIGMTIDGLKNMFSMYRENHNNCKSIGISGIGGKNSLKIASKNTIVEIFTLTSTGEYLKCSVPWDIIVETGKYSKMINRCFMDEDEKAEFIEERKSFNLCIKGTTIRFVYNDDLHNSILNNFIHDKDNNTMYAFDWCGIIYGKFDNVNFKYRHFQNPNEILEIKKYNYFSGENNDYYLEKTEYIIKHYRDRKNSDIFLFEESNTDNESIEDEKYFHFPSRGKGFSTVKHEYTGDLRSLIYIGYYKHTVGLKYNKEFFDPDIPLEPGITKYNTFYKNVYGMTLKTDKIDGETLLTRNNQIISSFYPFETPAKSSSRGNWKSFFLVHGVKSELEYEVNSLQNNIQDIVIGIQQNKNQFNDKDKPPKPLKRIIAEQRNNKANELLEYFNKLENYYPPSETIDIDTSEVEDTPSETIDIDTSEVHDIPTETFNIEDTPSETIDIDTSEVEDTPAETSDIEDTPAEVQDIPTETFDIEDKPVETIDTSEVQDIPTENIEIETSDVDENYSLLNNIRNVFIKYNQLELFKLMKDDLKNIRIF